MGDTSNINLLRGAKTSRLPAGVGSSGGRRCGTASCDFGSVKVIGRHVLSWEAATASASITDATHGLSALLRNALEG